MSEKADSTGRNWVPWWVWAGGFLSVLLLVVLGGPALAARTLASRYSWPFWPTYGAFLLVCYVLVPIVFHWLSDSRVQRLRATPCRVCRTVPGDRATVKRSGQSLLVICPRCGEVGSTGRS